MDPSQLSYRDLTYLRTLIENQIAFSRISENTDVIRRTLLNSQLLESVQKKIDAINQANLFNFDGDVDF
ncbi:hypothetical protein L596_009186 [Steinernema carpocapsae]|uniref:Uncharacterized protein n=1 Tax=Steinernema carpocapsae TaxID=34508 RepID=A0A4U5PEX0_STECR|nr:hypothetical protein L596_009186 [Steinernema carpocapsae]